MKLVHCQKLESLNYLSLERVTIARLELGAAALEPADRQRLLETFRAISHPANDATWDLQLAVNFQRATDWRSLIAAGAQYLQRIIARFDGEFFTDERLVAPNSIGLECLEFEVAEACIHASIQLACRQACGLAARTDQAADTDQIVKAVEEAHEEYSLGSVTGPLVCAARRMRVPTRRLDGGSLIQVGHGMFQRRFRRSCTDATGYVAELVSCNKALVKKLWKEIGLPVAEGQVVTSVEEAVHAMTQLGTPVVIKPGDADYGDGVTVNIQSAEQIPEAFEKATAQGDSVLMEKFMPGSSYRLLVLRGQVLSAVRRDPASVYGDGHHSVSELIDQENASGRRGHDRRWALYQLNREKVDQAYLAEQGMSITSVPPPGRQVWLQRDISHTDGGSTHEVLELVHPETLKFAQIAAECIGIDLAGVDLIAQDIGQRLSEQGGGLLEINAEPGIGLHLPPMCDRPRPIDEAIISSLFASGRPKRIPITLVIAESCQAAMREYALQEYDCAERSRALSTAEETCVDGMRLQPKSASLCDRLQAALLHPRTSTVVAFASFDEILDNGIGVDHLDTVVLGGALTDSECDVTLSKRHMLSQLEQHSDRITLGRHKRSAGAASLTT